jgi:hypothetical protein
VSHKRGRTRSSRPETKQPMVPNVSDTNYHSIKYRKTQYMNEVALVIIYNHRYDKNIEVLEKIYRGRFSNIYHLMPFYDGCKSNVIPVYENSYYFQGYLSQGVKIFFHEKFTHYFFIGDDVLLNPAINEKNYAEHVNIEKDDCFLPGFINLHERDDQWARIRDAYRHTLHVRGVEVNNLYPDYDTAMQYFSKHGLCVKPLSFDQVTEKQLCPKNFQFKYKYFKKFSMYLFYELRRLKNKNKKYVLPYPFIGSYSDIFIVSSSTIKLFCHYCGLLAATKLFVEIGLPTALVLSASKIITEKDLKLQGQALWKNDLKVLEKYEWKLRNLLDNFPLNNLYLHPIKLSKWDTTL